MSIILLLIIVSIVVAGGFLFAFIWAVRNGQYDDDYSPSMRILFDDLKKGNEKAAGKEDSTESETETTPKTKNTDKLH